MRPAIDRKSAFCKSPLTKTTLDLPDELVREVKIRAAHEQKKLRVMIVELLQKGIAATEAQRGKIPKPAKLRRRIHSEYGGYRSSYQLESRLAWSVIFSITTASARLNLIAQVEGNLVPTESSPDVKFEIGHVLFIDIVGYSKLLINQQSEQMQTLREIVRGTEQFRAAEAEGKLLRLPTGDGGALVFRTSPEAPVRCALEISKELKKHPELRVRMGIHSGAVNEITDLNEQANIAGAGINMAQRIMDCGDAGHILVSRHVAEDLEQYRQWQPYLHDLGECEVKHGARVHVFNLYTDEVGNRDVPAKLKRIAHEPAAGAVGHFYG